MDLGLTDKVALVTGGSRGIGRAVGLALAREGCIIHLAARGVADLASAAGQIKDETGASVHVHPVDLSSGEAVQTLLEAAGTPDILVNNAGAIPGGDLQAVTEDIWRDAWDLKVFGYINMTRAVYAAMKARGNGVIVNVTGLAAERWDVNYVAGTTGNAGLNAFTRAVGSMSLEDGIRVNAVSPGPVETERLVGLLKGAAQTKLGDENRWRELTANMPLGRPAQVDEVADMVVFLASQRAGYISGTIVTVDGGQGSRASSFS